MLKIGAHVSAAVSLETSFEKAKNIGEGFIGKEGEVPGFTNSGVDRENILALKSLVKQPAQS